ncbi:MAG: TonB family protein [Endozoicomonas sp.]|uniref:TonB family protein n=1 Tax=Endozoicomonas sp. TaxID=1892382 RepID=UPI003D9AD856
MLSRLLLPLLLFLCQSAQAESSLRLKGIGLYTELTASYYYGALYSSASGNRDQDILADGVQNRIAMRVSADQLKPRRFYKLWNSTLVINNSASDLEFFSNEVVDFTTLLKGRLIKGDELVIEEVEGKTRVSINGVEARSYDRPGFINLLVRGWVGPLPPLQAFKKDVLGHSSDKKQIDYQAQFEVLQPQQDRLEIIEGWYAESIPETVDEQTLEVAEEVAVVSESEVLVPTIESDSLLEEALVLSEEDQQKLEEEKRLQAEQLKRVEAEKARLLAIEQEKEREWKLILQEQEKLRKIQEIEAIYYQVLIRHVNQYVKYPKRALLSGNEGEVRVKLVIHQEGAAHEAILLEGSKVRDLDRAALKAVEKATPLPELPLELSEQEYEFIIPFQFSIAG